MDVSELLSSLVSGRHHAFVLPADTADPARGVLCSGLTSVFRVEHHASLSLCSEELSSDPLDFEPVRKAYLVPWPEDAKSFQHACAVVSGITGQSSVVGFLADTFPPKKNKDSSLLLSLAPLSEMDNESGTQTWVQAKLEEAGFRATPGAVRMVHARLGGHPEVLSRMVRALELSVVSHDLTEQVVLDTLPFIPDDDGKRLLDDLLHLRALSVCRRLSWLQGSTPVALFRAAGSEMVNAHLVATYLSGIEKGKLVDPFKVAEATGLREDLVRQRYMPLAKELGAERIEKFITRMEMADAVLLRTQFDNKAAATAIALQVCSV